MSQEGRVSTEEKIRLVEQYLQGKIRLSEALEAAGVKQASFQQWVARYESEGAQGLIPTSTKRVYSPEMKIAAVEDYLAGKGSQQEICKRYKIRAKSKLQNWIKVYNSGGDFKHKMSGGSRMKDTRKTTQEERVQIARECIENGNNYAEIAVKYQVSYQNVYTWVKKYRQLGEAGLEDRRGQRTAQQEPRTEEERLRIENAQLKHELYLARMERDLLKKLEEIRRKEAYRK